MKYLFTVVLIAFMWPAFAQTLKLPVNLAPDQVTVTTDESQYAVGEEVKVVVVNKSSYRLHVASYADPRCPISQLKNYDWQPVPRVPCSCGDVLCNMSEVYVEAGQTYHFSWDQSTSWCQGHTLKSAPAEPGIYRVTCSFHDPAGSMNNIVVSSQNIKIVE